MKLFRKLNVDRKIFEKISIIEFEFPDQPQEDDEGNREYKWKIIVEDEKFRDKKVTKLASQMLFRLYEGNGKAVYILGITDDGDALGISEKDLHETLCNINDASLQIDCDVLSIKIYKKDGFYISTIRFSKDECNFT